MVVRPCYFLTKLILILETLYVYNTLVAYKYRINETRLSVLKKQMLRSRQVQIINGFPLLYVQCTD